MISDVYIDRLLTCIQRCLLIYATGKTNEVGTDIAAKCILPQPTAEAKR